MVFPGGIATSSPVRGFLPTPLLRGLTIKTPKPLSSILSPRLRALLSELNTDSTAISAFTFVMFNCSATRFTMSCFITRTLHNLVTGYYLWLYTVSSHFYLRRRGRGVKVQRGKRRARQDVGPWGKSAKARIHSGSLLPLAPLLFAELPVLIHIYRVRG